MHDIISNLDGAVNRGHKQKVLIIKDLAKTFDKAPHMRLLHKLDYYGIRGSTHRWINSWLSGRTQQVVLYGLKSSPSSATRCAPGIGPRSSSFPRLHKRSAGKHKVFCSPVRRRLCPVQDIFTPGLFDLARRLHQLRTVGNR